jgi:hypothetical protein
MSRRHRLKNYFKRYHSGSSPFPRSAMMVAYGRNNKNIFYVGNTWLCDCHSRSNLDPVGLCKLRNWETAI